MADGFFLFSFWFSIMPLHLPGSILLGPRPAGSSAPATMAEFLTSIGKNSLYGGYRAGLGQYSSIDNSAPVTTDGASVRRWLPNWSAGGWAYEFNQTTGTKRPVYGTSRNGKSGIYGDGSDWYFALNSTTALNQSHTVLVSTWITDFAGYRVYAQNNNSNSLTCPANTAALPQILVNNAVGGVTLNGVLETTPASGSTMALRSGWVSVGTGFYNTAPNLFRASNATLYTASTIHEIWLIGASLTPPEITQALKFLI